LAVELEILVEVAVRSRSPDRSGFKIDRFTFILIVGALCLGLHVSFKHKRYFPFSVV
jgi:hypothetical protein